MKKRVSLATILTIFLIISAVILPITATKDKFLTPASTDTTIEDESKEEMRGLWVSYISLDMTGTDRSFESFKDKFSSIVTEATKMKCNTLIVQVRPFCDALYESEWFPSSHILSGIQGVSAKYDALEYMCKAAHENGLKLHAWINPLRVATANTPTLLANSNPYKQDSSIGFETESGFYLNPAKKTARKLITDGVAEIVRNYDIDGIHFDDYFYPADCSNSDASDYNTYKKSVGKPQNAMTLEQWRQNNINLLITEVYQKIKETDNSVEFGISPQGNIENDYAMGADIRSWCKAQGYVDYICPQMYYSTEHPVVRFEDSLKEWAYLDKHQNLKVYIGLGAYKAGTDADSGTWLDRSDVLATQLQLLREYGFDGYALYDYSALISQTAQAELETFRTLI